MLLGLYLHVCAVDYLARFTGPEAATLLSYPLWGLVVPALFFAFGKQQDDRWLGELSYPVYLIHYTIILVVLFLLSHFHVQRGVGVVSALVSMLAAAGFYVGFIAPLDQQRHRLAQTKS